MSVLQLLVLLSVPYLGLFVFGAVVIAGAFVTAGSLP